MEKRRERSVPVVPDVDTTACGTDVGRPAAAPGGSDVRPETPSNAPSRAPEARGIVDQAREQASTLASDAKERAVEVAGQAAQQVSTLVGQQKDRAAERLESLAGVVREAAHKLGTDQVGGELARYASRAADQVESMSSYVRSTDLQTFVRDAGQFARRRPELFLGGTFLTGLLAARFLKAASRNAQPAEPRMGGR